MRQILICFILISCFLFSCENSTYTESEPTVEVEEQDENKEVYTYMSDSEVEALINTKDPIFMSSFWIGMTEDETIEIMRYLVEKRLIYGSTFNPSTQEKESLSRDNINLFEFKSHQGYLHCNITPNGKSIRFDVNLIFENDGKDNSLVRIIVSGTENIEFKDFEDFISLFEEKYGAPTYVRKKPLDNILPHGDVTRFYSFKKGNKLIDISYESEHDGPTGGISPNQIHIVYEDKFVKEKESESFKHQLQQEKIKMHEERQKSLEKI